MNGPRIMAMGVVREVVPSQPGAYVLGKDDNKALYVGRSDSDLKAQLLTHFQPSVAQGAVVVTRFWFEVAVSPWDAFVVECSWYHQFAPTHNATHPTRPFGALYGCPICGR